jgi:phosphoribosylglycinamide formyltransferase 1
VKIAFYVSRNATRLRKLLKVWDAAGVSGLAEISFALIDHCGNSELRVLCQARKIPLFEEDLKNVAKGARNQTISDVLLRHLDSHGVDHCFLFCDRVLEGDILERYAGRIINCHPSILPHYGGLLSIDQALEDGATLLGNTLHLIDEGVDTGPILMQSVLHRSRYSDYDDVLDLQVPMLIQLIQWLKAGRVKVTGRTAVIEGGDYSGGAFYPALELNYQDLLARMRAADGEP